MLSSGSCVLVKVRVKSTVCFFGVMAQLHQRRGNQPQRTCQSEKVADGRRYYVPTCPPRHTQATHLAPTTLQGLRLRTADFLCSRNFTIGR